MSQRTIVSDSFFLFIKLQNQLTIHSPAWNSQTVISHPKQSRGGKNRFFRRLHVATTRETIQKTRSQPIRTRKSRFFSTCVRTRVQEGRVNDSRPREESRPCMTKGPSGQSTTPLACSTILAGFWDANNRKFSRRNGRGYYFHQKLME